MGRRLGVHYSGRLEIWRGNKLIVSRGVSCTSGLHATRIAADRERHTGVAADVTCARCRRLLAEHKRCAAETLAEAKRIIAYAKLLEREFGPRPSHRPSPPDPRGKR